MKRLLSGLLGSTLVTLDGPAGKVLDFYFDDITWSLRYAVVRSYRRREVLVPAHRFLPLEWDIATLPVGLNGEMFGKCPPAEAHRPVYRQKMDSIRAVMPWPEAGSLGALVQLQNVELPHGDPHLRSFRVVRRYHLASVHGLVGTAVDFAVDDQTWELQGLVAKTGRWMRKRIVLASLSWMHGIDWANGTIWTETHPADWHSAPALGWQIDRRA